MCKITQNYSRWAVMYLPDCDVSEWPVIGVFGNLKKEVMGDPIHFNL